MTRVLGPENRAAQDAPASLVALVQRGVHIVLHFRDNNRIRTCPQ